MLAHNLAMFFLDNSCKYFLEQVILRYTAFDYYPLLESNWKKFKKKMKLFLSQAKHVSEQTIMHWEHYYASFR